MTRQQRCDIDREKRYDRPDYREVKFTPLNTFLARGEIYLYIGSCYPPCPKKEHTWIAKLSDMNKQMIYNIEGDPYGRIIVGGVKVRAWGNQGLGELATRFPSFYFRPKIAWEYGCKKRTELRRLHRWNDFWYLVAYGEHFQLLRNVFAPDLIHGQEGL